MKKIFLMLMIVISLSAFAEEIEYLPEEYTTPSQTELASSRSCFEEVIRAGCKHPKEDQNEFRSCMSGHFSSLSLECQKMMSTLYGK